MNDLTLMLDPKHAHLPLSVQRGILARRLELEEEEREARRCQERIDQRHAEIAAKRAAEAAQKQAFEARRQAYVSRDTPFVMTSAARVVLDTIDRCVRFGHNGLVTGAARCRQNACATGGSTPLKHAGGAARRPRDRHRRDGQFDHGGAGGSRPSRRCAHRLQRRRDDEAPVQQGQRIPVLLFDEAQNLADRVARDLLALSEQAHVQMLFLGNDEVLKFVNSQKAAIQQIARRLPIREEIDCILDADADLLAGQYAVEDPEALRLCRTLAETHHADGIGKVLPIARAVADAAGSQKVNVDHLREALSLFPHFLRDLMKGKSAPQVERQSSFKRLPKRR